MDVQAALDAVHAEVEGSEPWARAMDTLAEAQLAAGDIDEAIGVRRLALANVVADMEPGIVLDLANNLGVDVMTRYQMRKDPGDLLEACAIGERVLAERPADQRLDAAANLAGRLAERSLLDGEHNTLDRAVHLIIEAIADAAADDPDRPLALSALAGVHLQVWHRDGDLERLVDGLRVITAGLAVDRAGAEAINIVGLIVEAAEETSDESLLAQAEALARAALDGTPATQPQTRVSLARLLATILFDRYEWTGQRPALDEAVATSHECVREAKTIGGVPLARALSVRAMVRSTAGHADGDQIEHAAAIDDARAALDTITRHDTDDGEYASNLASLLAERYDLLGDSTDLDEAIALLDGALAAALPADSVAPTAMNQAANLLSRFERDLSMADLDRGISLVESAIAATGPDSAYLAVRHDTAGRLRASRGSHLHQLDDLAAAEQHAAQAVRHTDPESPDYSGYLNNWAMWVTERWEQTRSADDLREAIELLERALAACSPAGDTDDATDDAGGLARATIAFNLGARLQARFELDLDRGHDDRRVLQRSIDLLDEVLGAGFSHLELVAGKRLGDIAWRLGLWPEAEHAFRLALEAAGELTGIRPQRPDKERARSGVQGIGALAALSAIRAGDQRAAALHLERASATIIAEAAGVPTGTVTFEGIVAGADRMRRHILLLGCTQIGGVAVLVAPDGGVHCAELPDLTEDAAESNARAFRATLTSASAEENDATGSAADDDDAGPVTEALRACDKAVDDLAAWTIDTLITPLAPLLDDVERLAVLPLGCLAWLPLTAPGTPEHPNIVALREPVFLIRATPTERLPQPAHSGEPTEAPSGGTGRRVIIWADAGPPGRRIPGVVREARRVSRAHPGADLRIADEPASTDAPDRAVLLLRSTRNSPVSDGELASDDTASAVLGDLLSADLVHLACHCDVDVDQPQNSVLHVRPPIRISTPPTVTRSRRCHVVLSACDAALTAATLPDEALSAATAFLLAGAGIVTAPLWPVSDAAAPAFMAQYHTAIAAGAAPAAALAVVRQQWSADHSLFVYGPWVLTAWPDAIAAVDGGTAAAETGP